MKNIELNVTEKYILKIEEEITRLIENNMSMQEEMVRTWKKLMKKKQE